MSNEHQTAEKVVFGATRFRVYVNESDDGVFILDGDAPTSSERWMGIGFKVAATKKAREQYAHSICALLNRGWTE